MLDVNELLAGMYRAFNARDIDVVLAALHPDVDWPNGWEGGRVRGRDGVREYWTRQWAEVAPSVEPVAFDLDELGRSVVIVRTVVRDLAGNIIHDGVVRHVYAFSGGLVARMDIIADDVPAS